MYIDVNVTQSERKCSLLFPTGNAAYGGEVCANKEHEGGHVVPHRAEDVRQLASFLEKCRDEWLPLAEATADDIDACSSLYCWNIFEVAENWVNFCNHLGSVGSIILLCLQSQSPGST